MSRACCPSVTGNLLLQTVIAIPGSQSSETHKVWGLSSPIVSPSGCSIFLVRYGGVLCTIHASFQYIQQGRNVLVRKRPRHFSSRLPVRYCMTLELARARARAKFVRPGLITSETSLSRRKAISIYVSNVCLEKRKGSGCEDPYALHVHEW